MGNQQIKDQIVPKKLFLVDRNKKKHNLIGLLMDNSENTYENFYHKLQKIPHTDPVDIIITTHGGQVLWCSKICYILKTRPGKSRVFVKSYAHSAGTIIALTASELYITYDTTFSAIDPQTFPFQDLIRTGLPTLIKLIENPYSTIKNITIERTQYFKNILNRWLNENIHNKELIIKNMHDESVVHEQLFFKNDMDNIGITYKLWDGNTKKLPLFTENIKTAGTLIRFQL